MYPKLEGKTLPYASAPSLPFPADRYPPTFIQAMSQPAATPSMKTPQVSHLSQKYPLHRFLDRHREESDLLRSITQQRSKLRRVQSHFNQRQEDQQQLIKFRWQKMMKKVTFQPPSEDYYENLPIKPGFLFFQSLFKAPKSQVSTLKLTVPSTIIFADHLYYLTTLPTGYLQCTRDPPFFDFLKRVESSRASLCGPLQVAAAIVRSRGDTEDSMSKQIIDWQMFRQKMTNREVRPLSMIQEFVRSPGGRPAVMRLFYHRGGRNTAANYAYQIVAINSHKAADTELLKKCTVDFSTPGNLEIMKQTGVAIKAMEDFAENIVMHLNRGYNLRIEKIVLDFLRDDTGRLYFCGCKGFLLDSVTISQALSQVQSPGLADSDSDRDLSAIEQRRQALEDRKKGSFVRCRLCRMHYSNLELAHSVSVRMLLLFKMHAAKRVELPLDTSHLKITTSDLLSQSVRVCPFCYVMVTSEFMLISKEKEVALAMNIPYREEPLEEDPRLQIQVQFLPKTFIQWRILIHFHTLTGLSDREPGLCLYLRMHDYVTKFPLNDIVADPIPVNALKLMYFFANPKKHIHKFLSGFKVEFTIESEKRVIMRGIVPILTEFPHTLKMGSALIARKSVALFNAKATESCELTTTVGIACDHFSECKLLKVALAKVLDVYIPEEHFCNADPLPLQWMEHFGEQPEDASFEDSRNDCYMPALTTSDVKRMQDLSARFPPQFKQLFQEPTPAVVSTDSVPSALQQVKKSKDSTYTDFDGLDTDISVRELFTTVKSYLGGRKESLGPRKESPRLTFPTKDTAMSQNRSSLRSK